MIWFKSPIARKLIFYILIVSSFLTLIVTFFQVYLDYRKDINQLNQAFIQIERSFLNSISESAWDLNEKLIQSQIDGITKMPYVIYAEAHIAGLATLKSGKLENENIRQELYPLIFIKREKEYNLGTLRVIADYNLIYHNLKNKILLIMVTQGVKTFIVSSSMFLIFFLLVTRHLTVLASQTKIPIVDVERDHFHLVHKNFSLRKKNNSQINFKNNSQKISKKGRKGKDQNELDELVNSLNIMVRNLKATQLKLVQTNEDLEYFVHVAAHDLKEPARRLSLFADLLSMQVQPTSENATIIENIKQSSLQITQMINDFRIFSQLGYGVIDRIGVNIKDLIEEVLGEFKIELEGVDVQFNLAHHQLTVYYNLVKVVYRNLIYNAIKYADNKKLSLIFSSALEEGKLVLGVFNTGSSIPEELKLQVFKPFRRFAKASGIGIGLSICKRIIDRHGGEIWVESGNEWVCFKFTLGGQSFEGGSK